MHLHLVYRGKRLANKQEIQLKEAGVEQVYFQLHLLPSRILCLYEQLTSCITGGRKYSQVQAFMLKPFMAWILPSNIPRVIMLDMDVAFLRPPHQLWAKFEFFDDALVGLAREQSDLYTWATNLAHAYNGGVQLLDLARMRGPEEARYISALTAACRTHEEIARQYGKRRNCTKFAPTSVRFGMLGDQSLYTYMAYKEQSLFFNIGCEWNRQLGSWLSSSPSSKRGWLERPDLHACPTERCAALHANGAGLKCAAALLRTNSSCANWKDFVRRTGEKALVKTVGPYDSGRLCGSSDLPSKRYATASALRTYYIDCCVPAQTIA
mmetsp:Transcript_10821/g.20987  ORF Transcript_10821/g.20987 Transcript_10821/m.20987 type:complete len:323 (-) Transcript_10821:378-1346(-)